MSPTKHHGPIADVDTDSTPSGGECIDLSDLFMSVLALVAFALAVIRVAVVEDHSAMADLIEYLDLGICVVFFGDFVRQVIRAEDRWRYLRTWGWFDLLSSVPAILVGGEVLGGAARTLRLARLARVLRAIRSIRILLRIGRRDPSVAVLAGLLLAGIVTFTGCCMGVLWAESRPIAAEFFEPAKEEGRLNTAEKVLWWAVVTSSTVGYGDYAPVTNAGRGFAVGLMVVGIGGFATLTSAFGVMIGRVRRRGRDPQDEVIERLDRLEATLARLERHLDGERR